MVLCNSFCTEQDGLTVPEYFSQSKKLRTIKILRYIETISGGRTMAYPKFIVILKVTLLLAVSFTGSEARSSLKFSPKSLVKRSQEKSLSPRDDVNSVIENGHVFPRRSAFVIDSVPRGGSGPNVLSKLINWVAVVLALRPQLSKDDEIVETKSDIVTRFVNWVGESKTRCWVALMVAIVMEITATAYMKTASDNDDANALGISMILYMLCLSVFGLTMKQIEMGVAYAVWSGLGTALTTSVGILFFNEARHFSKILCVGLILFGCVGLNLFDGEE